MTELLDITFYHNALDRWILALGIAAGMFVLLRVLVRVVRGRFTALAGRTETEWDDVVVHALGRTRRLFLLVLAACAGAATLTLPPRPTAALRTIVVLVVLFQVGVWFSAALGMWLDRYAARELEQDRGAATSVRAVGFVGKLVLWSVVLLVALDNVGVDVTTLVAGLGVGGIAVALAVQAILGDLFASLSIVLDKPFVLGDFIVVDDQLGSVEYIGLKTTRVRSLWGEQVVFANGDLLKSRLRNYGRMRERRVAFELGVTYQTPRDKLMRMPGMIREAIEAQERTRFDRSHFKAYGDFALTFESVYYVLSPDYNAYMDIQQAINLAIHERFEAEGIEFAYPTQTLHLLKAPT